jgi:hypothetical protein
MSEVNRHVGSSLGDFLWEDNLLDEARALAIADAVAFDVQKATEAGNSNKVEGSEPF